MENLRKYFDFILNFEHRNSSSIDRCHNLFLIGAVLSKKPEHILELGIGSGYVTLSLIHALKYNGMGSLTCVDNWFDWGGHEPEGIEVIRSAGVNVVAPASEQEFVHQCPSDFYDFLIADADPFLSGLWIDEHLRITRDNGFMFFRNTNRKDDLPNLQLIEKRIKELGLAYYHFIEQSRPDECCRSGWLFAINAKPKTAAIGHMNIKYPDNKLRDWKTNVTESAAGLAQQPEAECLYLGLVSGKNYGWGVCSQYLIEELSKKTMCHVLSEVDGTAVNKNLNGKLFQALTSGDFFAMFENARGVENYGYTFFENELTAHSVENAKKYNLVLAGSTWCRERMDEKGIYNNGVLIQGIDSNIFYPIMEDKPRDSFIIFSGGKFELRKGQDLVLRAVKILQEKYADIILVNCWYNKWPASMKLMTYSPFIQFEYKDTPWHELMNHTYRINGLDPSRIQTLDLVPNEMQREIYKHTDIGIFPNRCEGGTNLVLMEYMACAKPVIASNTSGHKDIVTNENALLLNALRDISIAGSDNQLIGRWQEPALDELVAQIEYAYHHRAEIKKIGIKAGQDLQNFTWEKSAQNLIDLLQL
jgi:glycosyltransferase involved in cell wall biosynthesis